MAMKRTLKWIAAVLAVLLLGIATAIFLWPRDRITVESWREIRLGMTEKEVAAILGGPGMNGKEYGAQRKGKPPLNVVFSEPAVGRFHVGGEERIWIGHRGSIEIQFDSEGHVAFMCFAHLHPADPNFLDGIRDWLGW
jgi:hypothetical protein